MVIDRESNFVPIPVELRRFFRGKFSKILLSGAWLGWGSYFYLASKKQHTSEHPARSETGSGILGEFWSRADLYNLQKSSNTHIAASGVDQGHSRYTSLPSRNCF
jgi:hypothetical protein